jgi:hypothetical protein
VAEAGLAFLLAPVRPYQRDGGCNTGEQYGADNGGKYGNVLPILEGDHD